MELGRRILTFGLTGLLATATHFCVLALLAEGAGLVPWLANGAAFLVALGVTWTGQRHVVFRTDGHLGRFLLVAIGGLAANTALMALFTTVAGLHWIAGFIACLAIVPAATFVISSLWVFGSGNLKVDPS